MFIFIVKYFHDYLFIHRLISLPNKKKPFQKKIAMERFYDKNKEPSIAFIQVVIQSDQSNIKFEIA